MTELSPQQAKRVEGIVKLVKEFLDARFEHALRINPNISHVQEDLSWQQIVTLENILKDTKAFGPVRYYVCDILASDDEAKKDALFSSTDQNSIMNEIVNLTEDTADRRIGILSIRDMRSFYKSLDPSLERIVELIQTWLWWDLPYAADIFCFDQEYHRILKLAKQSLNEKIADYYRKAMRRTGDVELTKHDILEYEVESLEHILKRLIKRVDNETGFDMILKRDKLPSEALDNMIINLARHKSNLKKIKEMDTITEELRKTYSKMLQVQPQDVTREMIIQYEQTSAYQLQIKVRDTLNLGQALGEPYNYKEAKNQKLIKRFNALKNALFPSKEKAPAAVSSE